MVGAVPVQPETAALPLVVMEVMAAAARVVPVSRIITGPILMVEVEVRRVPVVQVALPAMAEITEQRAVLELTATEWEPIHLPVAAVAAIMAVAAVAAAVPAVVVAVAHPIREGLPEYLPNPV